MAVNTVWLLIILTAAAHRINAEEAKSKSRHRCRPVMLLHGLLCDAKYMEPIAKRIKKDYPRTDVFNSNAYPNLATLRPLWEQVNGTLSKQFSEFCRKHPEGITVIGHSQGALLFRALIETHPDHCVHTFISIAGPQRGEYGLPSLIRPVGAISELRGVLELMTLFYYNPLIQRMLSYASDWHDPRHNQKYLKQNNFLPVINNEVSTDRSESHKAAFLKLKKHVTVAGADDGVVIPWQSSLYSFYGDHYPAVVDYQHSEIYKKDLFGLRTLDESGRWTRYVKNGTKHMDFLTNDQVYKEAIFPYLDCKKSKS